MVREDIGLKRDNGYRLNTSFNMRKWTEKDNMENKRKIRET